MNATLRHVGIRVTDMVTSINFYQRYGFKAISCLGEKWGANTEILCVKMQDERGNVLELIEGPWLQFHIALEVEVLPTKDILREKFGKDADVVYIKDPSGNNLELVKVRKGE